MSSTTTLANPQTAKSASESKQNLTKKKIWVDLDNSPHVPFFRPIIEELRNRGYEVFVTARDAYQVRELIDFYGVPAQVVGKHDGKHKLLKAIGTVRRAIRLTPIIRGERPALAVCHGSRGMILACALLKIPCLMLIDYEFTAVIPGVKPTWVMVPSVVPNDAKGNGNKIIKYPGIKEDVYLSKFKPDISLRKRLGIPADHLVITVRPPATEAHYHNPEAETLLTESLNRFVDHPNTTILLLPRNKRQEDEMRSAWVETIASRKILIPQHVEDGLNLIWNSDLVISGGGTMNREAAAMGVPVYSIFRGKIGAVDHYLAQQGRLALIETVEDVRTKIKASKRESVRDQLGESSPALETIVRTIVSIVETQAPGGATDLKLVTKTKQETVTPALNISSLCELAVAGLPGMFDASKNLFCYRVTRRGESLVREGISHRYTMMTLLGLHQWVKSGGKQPFDAEAVFAALTAETDWITNIGDLGLLLWTTASAFPQHIGNLASVLDPSLALKKHGFKEQSSMELAWFLSGCAHLAAEQPNFPGVVEAANATCRVLLQNQGESGAFGHQSERRSVKGLLRGRIGSFADQVYPIVALSHMAQTFEMKEPLSRARACAKVICDAQGNWGEWWWHYDSATGRVISKHPVYSVHQEAMGPMALFALSHVTGEDYTDSIVKGLNWITGQNELHFDMRDQKHNLVWRSFYQDAWRSYFNNFRNLGMLANSTAGMKVLYECRPYELGWLLYAFAGR